MRLASGLDLRSPPCGDRAVRDGRRRSLIAKVHVAKKELLLADDDYRAMLLRVTGKSSAADLTERQLEQLLDEMKAKGFKPRPAGTGGRPADHPQAMKARALWISLHQLGAIVNASEEALEAFARRQTGCEKLQWANRAHVFKLIEALKAIATRHGWDQSTEGLAPVVVPRVLRTRLCEAILKRLKDGGLAGADWTLERAARSLGGIDPGGPALVWDIGELDAAARCFGARLRGGPPLMWVR